MPSALINARSRRGGRPAFALGSVFVAILLAFAAPDTRAAGFGEVQVGSQLGDRLYARIPIVGEGAAEVTPDCVRLIPESVLQDAPALNNARVSVDRKGSALVVTTPGPVMEPAVSFVLEMGCSNRFRREFVLLLDPPDLPVAQGAGSGMALVPPAARVIPADEPRWGTSASGGTAVARSAPAPYVSEPPASVAPAPRAEEPAPKPRPKPVPKPAAKPQVAAQPKPIAKTPSAPPPAEPPKTTTAELPKASGADRLVLADSDPAAARPTVEQAAAKDAREEALNKQIEALTKEVARMREDMDKLAARNRELAKEAESSRTGWFAAAGLAIVFVGVGLGLMGRREKKTWRDTLGAVGADPDASTPAQPNEPAVQAGDRAMTRAPSAAPVTTGYRPGLQDAVTDLDVTKLDVREMARTGMHATLIDTTSTEGAETRGATDPQGPKATTGGSAYSPTIPLAPAPKADSHPLHFATVLGTAVTAKKADPVPDVQTLDFSLDDIETPDPGLAKGSASSFSASLPPSDTDVAAGKSQKGSKKG